MTNFETRDEKVTCADSYILTSTIYTPKIDVKGAVLIGPATGIKRQFYAKFASFLAENGYGVITFDNRGIGESLHGLIQNCEVTLQCWGEKDMPAVLTHLQTTFPNTKYHLVGHSAGGQLIGLMENAREISSMFNVASSSGQLSNMHLKDQFKAHFFMNIFMPVSNFLFGHVKSQWVGMGEPLPKKVSQQWQYWCNGSGYVKTAFGKTVHTHLYNELTTPSMWINSPDDFIANNKNVQEMISVFANINAETKTLLPHEYGLKEIGHMKFFSKKSQNLWSYAIDWLEKN